MQSPDVTALMITTGRLELVAQSVADYQRQTYGTRAMVIVTDGPESVVTGLLQLAEADPSIRVVRFAGGGSLGELRNVGLDAAPSDWTIQWDDDDWYHPDRLAHQVAGIKPGKSAVLLQEQLHYRRDTGEFAWIRKPVGIDGTILYDRRYPLRYPALRRSEDTALVAELRRHDQIALVPGGIHYCRTYHGANAWGAAHHVTRMRNLSMSADEVRARWAEVVAASRVYPWRADSRLVGRGTTGAAISRADVTRRGGTGTPR